MDYSLTDIQLDVVRELMNLGVNESTNILSHMLKVEIELNIPIVRIIKLDELMPELQKLGSNNLTAVNLEFKNGFRGVSQLVFSQDAANKLIGIFSRELLEIDEIDEIKSGALIEIGNIVLNAVLAEFSNFLKHEFNFFVPNFYENYENDFFVNIKQFSGEVALLGQTLFNINQHEISGDIIIFLKIESFKHFISLIDNYLENF